MSIISHACNGGLHNKCQKIMGDGCTCECACHEPADEVDVHAASGPSDTQNASILTKMKNIYKARPDGKWVHVGAGHWTTCFAGDHVTYLVWFYRGEVKVYEEKTVLAA